MRRHFQGSVEVISRDFSIESYSLRVLCKGYNDSLEQHANIDHEPERQLWRSGAAGVHFGEEQQTNDDHSMAAVALGKLLAALVGLVVERGVRLRLPSSMVQPDRDQGPSCQSAVLRRRGAVAGERGDLPAPVGLHADALVAPGLAVASHLQVEDGVRNEAGHGLRRQRAHEAVEPGLELRDQGHSVQPAAARVLPGDVLAVERRRRLPGARRPRLGTGGRARLPRVHRPVLGRGQPGLEAQSPLAPRPRPVQRHSARRCSPAGRLSRDGPRSLPARLVPPRFL